MVQRTALVLLLGLIVLAVLAPALPLPDADRADWDAMLASPTTEHWLGTDIIGRDMLARTLAGARISLLVGALATLVSVIIGTAYGVLAAYLPARFDGAMLRGLDLVQALPFMFLVVALSVVFGQGLGLLLVAIGAVTWLDTARIVRHRCQHLLQSEYVQAAGLAGCSRLSVFRRHLMPDLLPLVLVYAVLTMPQAIMLESTLSFLGLGVREPQVSWGLLIADGVDAMNQTPWVMLPPALALLATLWSVNVLGDHCQRALTAPGRGTTTTNV